MHPPTRVVAKLAILAGLMATASVAPAFAASSPADDPAVKAQIGLFSAWLDGQIAIRQLPGVVVGVVSDQDLIWAKGFGNADIDAGRPMELDTRFRMASHSKLFTATAIMQLREQGKVRLDDPVTEYLPWFAMKSLL